MTASEKDLNSLVASARRNRLADLLWRSAARTPNKTALIYKGIRHSFSELDTVVNRVANAFAARGISRGDHVAMVSHNNHAFVVTRFALARLGAVMVPINFMLNASEIAFILDNAEAKAVVVEDALVATVDAAIAEAKMTMRLKCVIEESGATVPKDWEPISILMRHDDTSAPDVAIGDDEAVQLLYTSGTESRPKGALLSARSLYAHYASCIADGEMSASDIEVHSLPLYHCAQLDCFLTPDLYIGATSIILSAPDPANLLKTIEEEGVTKLFCPPTVWIAILRHPDFGRRNLSSLKKGYYGASIMPMEIIKEIHAKIPGIRLFNFYGQTEMSPVATILSPEDQMRKLGSAGRAALNVETRVVDDNDVPVAVGVIGEIVHRSPHATLGYWKNPEKTAEAFRNGWFHSGDLGVFDEEGYLTVVDRKKDMIKTGGENVASREVEEVIFQHASVAEVAVFGVPHPRWIEAVMAVVVLRSGAELSVDTLMTHCRDRLAGYKAPKHIAIINQLPKNASGKILKRELRDRYAKINEESSANA
ncbi:acyl-CoA synthetase [Stenotrophobium rhamnosiphilum]|uniref:Acyl-CoA synthetase n=1 Tax=Stenotrophobium rhamnosiphilum TaxID=2029166 RepID=A0A2T5MED4_9GAMM|nr:acyl-CoA synthetase [Stenotrophobium rhamnosiphilum]PTU30909.1 acyl-CoA synthetase [Stenotrophobium rhamnosiphilum]